MGKRALQDFIQQIQNKVSITSAIAVIKLKPINLTGEQYAIQIQKLVFDSWVKSSDESIFEIKIIELQRYQLIKEINGLLVQPADHDYQSLNSLKETIPGVCSDFNSNDSLFISSDDETSDKDDIQNNLSFIQALIQLKFAVGSSNTIAIDTVVDFLNTSSNETNVDNNLENNLSYSEDSGFGEYNSQGVVNSISSSAFKLITHSSRTDHLIKKCMVSILHSTHKCLLHSPVEMYSNWKASIWEYCCSVLKKISFHTVCSNCVLSFITKTVVGIWESEDLNKHLIWEYQFHILLEFCVNSHICESAIDTVMDKFTFLTSMIQQIEMGTPEHLNNIHIFEKVPHFAQFVFLIIEKLHSLNSAVPVHQNKSFTNCTYDSVIDMWKLRWKTNIVNQSLNAQKSWKDTVKKWNDICEEMTTSSAENFPMISIYMWDVIEKLQKWIKEMG